MRLLSIGVAFGLAAGLGTAAGQSLPGWSLVWADEFDQPDGSAPSASKWVYDLGGGGWGNNELQSYTSRTNNARIVDGKLVIEAKKETYTGSDNITRNYTSARLKTKGKAAWTYGRIEARIKVARGQGIWPAFWMLGANIDSVGWPTCGEIDIMENIGREPGIVHGTIHGPGYSGGSAVGGSRTLPDGALLADEFHRFAVEWETNRIRWYLDDQLYFTAGPASLPAGKQWVFDKPQFILLNLAVGGNWPGAPDATTVFPQQMTVDYVRVYARSNGLACGGNLLLNPGFETGSTGDWNVYSAGFNTSVLSSNAAPVRQGSNAFKVFGQFTGSDNYSGVFQDKSCFPGEIFNASGWMLTTAGDRIAGANTAWLEVTFRDSGGNMLALYRSDSVSATSPTGTWLYLAVTNQHNVTNYAKTGSTEALVAPSGTSAVRCQVVFRQPANAGGAVFVDDLKLASGPILLPVASTARRNGNNLNLTFSTEAGGNYQVQYTEGLSDLNWQMLGSYTGNGSNAIFQEVMDLPRRFYRVCRMCN